MKRPTSIVDKKFTHAVRLLPPWLMPTMRALSYIGRPVFTIAILGVIGFSGLVQHNLGMVLAAIVAGATFGINSLLKVLVRRPRPDGYKSEMVILPTFSFPSGHAASAVVIFGLLAYVLFRLLAEPWGAIIATSIAVGIIGIGISRVYIGAHYPSDVIVGWLVGAVGLAAIVLVVWPL